MQKGRALLKWFEGRMGLQEKAEKRWFRAAFALLFLYLTFVDFGQSTVLLALPLCAGGLLLVSRLKRLSVQQRHMSGQQRRFLFIGGVFLLTFAAFFLWQLAYWPRSFIGDSRLQYAQATSGEYANWHPVLHTWLFFRVPYVLFGGSVSGIVAMQILWFSLAVAYMLYVLYSSGCPKAFLIGAWLFIALNPNNTGIMLHPWKDCALTIFSMVLFSHIVRIYLTEGAWLKKWYNLASFSLFAFLTAEMRHNALLLVVPAFIILFASIRTARKRMCASAACVLVASILLHGPVFALAHVEAADQGPEELLGLPLTMLSDIYAQDPDVLGEDARNFMASLATEEEWKDHYELGSYNSIKFNTSAPTAELVQAEGTGKILQYTLEAAVKRPLTAWNAFSRATAPVWGFGEGSSWSIKESGGNALGKLLSAYNVLISFSLVKYLFRYVGVMILVLLFLAVGKLGGGGLSRAMLVLAPMAYNFGTMLLLSGPDFRFFHFNFLIVIPLAYLLLRERELPERAGE